MDEPTAPALDAALAVADLGAVEVTGDDRISFLHGVLTHDVAGAEPGEVRGALWLDAHGAPLAMTDVAVLEGRVVLVTAARALADEVTATLGSRTFLADARFAVLDVEARSLRGEKAQDVAAAAGLEVPPGRVAECDGVLVVGRDDGVDLVGAPTALEPLVGRLTDAGAEEAGPEALESWRVHRGVPAWGSEVRAPHLPEEAGLLPTHVHLAKGCYPGQEAVARMWMLGRPRRRLARVGVEGDVTAGWSAGEGRARAEVTSTATYAGERVGLAYVPADASPGDRFAGVDGSAVEVRAFVGEGLDIPGRDPKVVRRRDRR